MSMRYLWLVFLACLAPPSYAVDVEVEMEFLPVSVSKLNEIIDETNFIVNRGCSGTLISKEHRLILTAHHCVDTYISWINKNVVIDGEVKKKRVEVRKDVTVEQRVYDGSTKVGGSSYRAEILAYSDMRNGHDLALLQLRADKIPMTLDIPILIEGREAQRAEAVYVIGNPAGQDNSVTKGILVSVNREFEGTQGIKTKMLQTDAEVFFGNSGGVLMSADGFYLGTVSRGIPGTAVIFAIHYQHVRDMLEDNCYAELYDAEADSFQKCDEERKAKKEEEGETLKGLLKKLVKKDSINSNTDGSIKQDAQEAKGVEYAPTCLTTLKAKDNFAFAGIAPAGVCNQ